MNPKEHSQIEKQLSQLAKKEQLRLENKARAAVILESIKRDLDSRVHTVVISKYNG